MTRHVPLAEKARHSHVQYGRYTRSIPSMVEAQLPVPSRFHPTTTIGWIPRVCCLRRQPRTVDDVTRRLNGGTEVPNESKCPTRTASHNHGRCASSGDLAGWTSHNLTLGKVGWKAFFRFVADHPRHHPTTSAPAWRLRGCTPFYGYDQCPAPEQTARVRGRSAKVATLG